MSSYKKRSDKNVLCFNSLPQYCHFKKNIINDIISQDCCEVQQKNGTKKPLKHYKNNKYMT